MKMDSKTKFAGWLDAGCWCLALGSSARTARAGEREARRLANAARPRRSRLRRTSRRRTRTMRIATRRWCGKLGANAGHERGAGGHRRSRSRTFVLLAVLVSAGCW